MFPTLLETGVDVFVVQVSVTRKFFVIAGLATSRQDFIRKKWKRKNADISARVGRTASSEKQTTAYKPPQQGQPHRPTSRRL